MLAFHLLGHNFFYSKVEKYWIISFSYLNPAAVMISFYKASHIFRFIRRQHIFLPQPCTHSKVSWRVSQSVMTFPVALTFTNARPPHMLKVEWPGLGGSSGWLLLLNRWVFWYDLITVGRVVTSGCTMNILIILTHSVEKLSFCR